MAVAISKTLDTQYVKLLQEILEKGNLKEPARENMPSTYSIFDRTIQINPKEGLPILQGKQVKFKQCLTELIWFLRGDTNIKFLIENGCNIWNKDCYRYYKELGGNLEYPQFIERVKSNTSAPMKMRNRKGVEIWYNYGDCGKIYGSQWRNFGCISNTLITGEGVDQITNLVNALIKTPNQRYHIVNAWNAKDRQDHNQALPACHVMFFCNVRKDNKKHYLDLSYIQRSCDMPLGVPFNLLSYGILHRILCALTGYEIGIFKAHLMDTHFYLDQMEYVEEYIRRYNNGEIPSNKVDLKMDSYKWNTIDDINIEDFSLINYEPLSEIKANLSVGL